ncbi:MAG: hypothetical protein AAF363_19970 [Bacteroidota bacterium]
MKESDDLEKILDSLEGIEKAEPKPFFKGRVLNKLENFSSEVAPNLRFKIKIAFVCSVIIVFLNSYLVFDISESNSDSTEPISEFAEDYNLSLNTVYFQDQEL